jgi:hypothetical protein
LAEIKQDDPASRTFAEVVAENLVDIACSKGPGAVSAINEIGDRLEGRPTQAVQISDLTREIREKSDAELQFYLDNNRWPSDDESAAFSIRKCANHVSNSMRGRHVTSDKRFDVKRIERTRNLSAKAC